MSQSKSEPFQITTIITFDDGNFPQAVTVQGFGGMPSNAVRHIAQEALDRHFGLTAVRHGYTPELTPVEDFAEKGVETMVFEVFDTVASRRIQRAQNRK